MSDENTVQRVLIWVLGALDRLLNLVERAIMAVVSATLIIIMLMVAADAVSRYALNMPISFNYDLVQMYLLPLVMLMPVGLLLRRSGHISVDLFANLMPSRLRQFVLGVAFVASAPVFWVMSSKIGLQALESWELGLATTGVINWPVWPHQAVFCIAMCAMALRLAHIGLTNLVAFFTSRNDLEISVLPKHDDPAEEVI